MGNDQRRNFASIKNKASLSTEIGSAELILLVIGTILFLTIGSLQKMFMMLTLCIFYSNEWV